MGTIRGIDVSKWNGVVNFKTVKKAGFSFVIIKAGGSDVGLYEDPKFKENYKAAKEAGLKVGCYFYLGKTFPSSDFSGMKEANYFLSLIHGKQFEYPCFLDVEEHFSVSRETISYCLNWVAQEIRNEGFIPGFYGSDIACFSKAGLVNKAALHKWPIWVARYGGNPTVVDDWMLWQYGNAYRFNGMSADFDVNESRYDFDGKWPIELGEIEAPQDTVTIRQIAAQVIAGMYGVGAERKKNLEAKGYNYREVQNMVNQILKENTLGGSK